MIKAHHTLTNDISQDRTPTWLRIGRGDLIEITRQVSKLHSQAKDGILKGFLSRIGITQSRHINKVSIARYQIHLKKYKKPKRNYFSIDTKLFQTANLFLRASELFQLIQLASWCVRSGQVEQIIMAPWELKNLLSGALGKQTINRNLLNLDKLGLITLRRGGVGKYGKHYYAKWIIKIELFCVRFKTVNTSLFNSYSLVSNSYKSTFIGILRPMPPPTACPFKDEIIEKAFTDLLPTLPYTQEDYDWYCLTQNKIDRKRAIKNIAKKSQGQKAILKKAIKRHGLWNGTVFKNIEHDQHNHYNALTSFESFWHFLPTLPNYKQIKNLTGVIIADLKGRKSIYDQFLKWADARHEADKLNARRPEKKTPEQVEDDKRWSEYVKREEESKRLKEEKEKRDYDERTKGMSEKDQIEMMIKRLEESLRTPHLTPFGRIV